MRFHSQADNLIPNNGAEVRQSHEIVGDDIIQCNCSAAHPMAVKDSGLRLYVFHNGDREYTCTLKEHGVA